MKKIRPPWENTKTEKSIIPWATDTLFHTEMKDIMEAMLIFFIAMDGKLERWNAS